MDDSTSQRLARPRLQTVGVALIGFVVLGGLVAILALRPFSRIAVQGNPDHRKAVLQGRAYLQQNRPDLALKTVSHIRDESKDAGEAMCVAGMALAQMEQYRPARIALERALRLQPKQPMAAKALASLHLALGDTDRGLDCLKKAAELSPRDFRPWMTMGRVHLDLGQYPEASAVFAEAIRRNRYDVESRLGRIEALLNLGKTDEAGLVVSETLAQTPENAKLFGLAARLARDTGNADEARSLADRALAIDPNETEALMVRAKLNFVSGRLEDVIADLRSITAINPNHLAALNLLTQTLGRLGRREEAAKVADRRKAANDRLSLMDALTQEILKRPDDPEPRWRLGMVAVESGQRTLALNCFQAALALNPKYEPALKSLAAVQAMNSPTKKTTSGP